MSRRLWQRVGRVKIYRDTDNDEYEVLDERQREGEGYFTSDKVDAVDTANAILRGKYNENAGAKVRYRIHSYASAQTAYHDAHRGRKRGKISNNTFIDKSASGNGYSVILHRTPIVTYHPDGSVELNSGGYQTVTTKARMNEVLPPGWGVSQQNFEWTVHTPGGNHEFFDRMVIQEDGTMSLRPLDNPRRYDRAHPGYKGADIRFNEDFAHRGYLVKYAPIHETYYISKGGHHIGSAASAERAREIIDELTAE